MSERDDVCERGWHMCVCMCTVHAYVHARVCVVVPT